VMSIDPEKRKELKINKSTLWYEQKKIKEGKTIKMYGKTKVRIEWMSTTKLYWVADGPGYCMLI
ncbi:MAG: hypothetical protein ACP5IB_08250, partial [Thermoplasmata archaeon]